MKIKLFNIALYSCLSLCVVGLWEGGASPKAVRKPMTLSVGERGDLSSTLSFMPVVDLDFSDLDARDAQNRPIKSSIQKALLVQLFNQNLFDLTVLSNSHAMRLMWFDIESFSHLFHSSFFNSTLNYARLLVEGLLPPSRRFVHNVGNLWITVSVGVFMTFLLVLFSQPKRNTCPVPLRC